MFRWVIQWSVVAVVIVAGGVSSAQPRQPGLTLAVTMTNDPTSNEIKVYDTSTNALVQTLSTGGAGGVAGGDPQLGRPRLEGESAPAVPPARAVDPRDEDLLEVQAGWSPRPAHQ